MSYPPDIQDIVLDFTLLSEGHCPYCRARLRPRESFTPDEEVNASHFAARVFAVCDGCGLVLSWWNTSVDGTVYEDRPGFGWSSCACPPLGCSWKAPCPERLSKMSG